MTDKSVENWSFTECAYFVAQIVTTVGYGDITPTTRNSRLFTIFYVIIGVFVILNVLIEIADGTPSILVIYLSIN
jgi:hypothetical protein